MLCYASVSVRDEMTRAKCQIRSVRAQAGSSAAAGAVSPPPPPGDTLGAESTAFLAQCGQPWLQKPFTGATVRRAIQHVCTPQ